MDDGLQSDVARVVQALSPLARWYAVISAMAGLNFWTYADTPFESWPLPAQALVWIWLGCSVAAPPYVVVNSALAALAAWLLVRKEPARKGPAPPAPPVAAEAASAAQSSEETPLSPQ